MPENLAPSLRVYMFYHVSYIITDKLRHRRVNSVLTHYTVVNCVGSQAVPSCHVAPLLGLDYDAQHDQQVLLGHVTAVMGKLQIKSQC